MPDKDPFTEHVDAAHKALLKMIEHSGTLGLDPGKLLESLFKHYTDRMLSDNERIWRTGALFVPISLAAFAALTAVKCLQVWQILVLGAPSIGLMFAWIVIAENHRAFQQKSEAWLTAIQRVIGLEGPRQVKVEAGGREGLVTRKGAIQNMRWYLLYGVIAAWTLILIGACVSWFYSPCAFNHALDSACCNAGVLAMCQ